MMATVFFGKYPLVLNGYPTILVNNFMRLYVNRVVSNRYFISKLSSLRRCRPAKDNIDA